MLRKSRPALKVPMTPELMATMRTLASEQGTTVDAIVHKALANLAQAWTGTPVRRQTRIKAKLSRATRTRLAETPTGLKKVVPVNSVKQPQRITAAASIIGKTGKLSARFR